METYLEYGGQAYRTVKIGSQVWMAENLNYETEGSKFYEDNPNNGAKYGRLYNWETAMKVCPAGWHLPSSTEWDILYRYVDGNAEGDSLHRFVDVSINAEWDRLMHFTASRVGCIIPYKSPTAGKILKAAEGWSENGNGTDNYGFSALPGGFCYSRNTESFFDSDNFYDIGDFGRWWSADENLGYCAYYRYMYYNDDFAYWDIHDKNCYMFSVRYVRD